MRVFCVSAYFGSIYQFLDRRDINIWGSYSELLHLHLQRWLTNSIKTKINNKHYIVIIKMIRPAIELIPFNFCREFYWALISLTSLIRYHKRN